MKGRSATALAVVITIFVTIALPVILSHLVAAPLVQEATGKSTWTLSRTPDGQPDLQGYWTNATYTPLERPEHVTKEFYTEEEYAALRTSGTGDGRNAGDHRTTLGRWIANPEAAPDSGSLADVHYDFSQFGLARTQSTVVETLRTSLITDPPDGRIPPLTTEGESRAADRAEARRQRGGRWDAAENNFLSDRCIIVNAGPPVLPSGYNNAYQILQGQGYVVILVEMIHDARIIPLDGRPHPASSIRQWMGGSRGHWEGETLVVETTNFTDKTAFRGSSKNLRIVERFTRVADDTILYSFTAEDPSTWTRPWSAEVPMKKRRGPIVEYACHEGNYSMYNALSGARSDEERAAEDAARYRQLDLRR